jgi:hypothetical protein
MNLTSRFKANLREAIEKAGFPEVKRMVEEAVPPSQELRVEVPYFLEVELAATVSEVSEAYAAWILGVGSYEKKRQDRLDVGLPRDWGIHRILGREGEGIFHGNGALGLTLETRTLFFDNKIKRIAIDFIHHSDGKPIQGKIPTTRATNGGANPPIAWRTIVDIEQVRQDVVRVRHALATRYPISYFKPWRGGCPQILKQLLKDQRVIDPIIPSKAMRVSMADAPIYVSMDLMNQERLFPHLVITCPKRVTNPLIDPDKLQNQLFGLVQVVLIEQVQGKDLFTETIAKKGLGREFSVFDGGIRLYLPTFGPDSTELKDHRLWTKRIFDADPIGGYYSVIQQAAWVVTHLRLPSDFLSLILKIDQQRNLARAQEIISIPESATQASQTELLKDLKGQLEMAIDETDELNRERQILEGDVARLRASEESLQDLVRRMRNALDNTSGEEEQDLVLEESAQACLIGNPTLVQSLHFLETNFTSKVRVLDSAWESAREAEGFKHKREVFDLLVTLVTQYPAALMKAGDAQAKSLFSPGSYASHDKKNMSKKGERLRTFEYRGEEIFMERHLKIDGGDSVFETWRCHFYWDSDRQLIVIGHCGKHLDFD